MSTTNQFHKEWLKRVLSASIMTFALPCAVFAGTGAELASGGGLAPGDHRFACALGGEERIVEVDYAENNGLPCSVEYEKNGEHQRLWQASNEINFCAQQAQAFIANLESHGWSCALELTEPTTEAPDSAKRESQAGEYDTVVQTAQ